MHAYIRHISPVYLSIFSTSLPYTAHLILISVRNQQPNPIGSSSHFVLLVHRQSRIVPLDQLGVHPLRIQKGLDILHVHQIHLTGLLFRQNLLDDHAIDPRRLRLPTIQSQKLLIKVFRRHLVFDRLELLVLQFGLTMLQLPLSVRLERLTIYYRQLLL